MRGGIRPHAPVGPAAGLEVLARPLAEDAVEVEGEDIRAHERIGADGRTTAASVVDPRGRVKPSGQAVRTRAGGRPTPRGAGGGCRGQPRIDHGSSPWYKPGVETMAISKFKATCLATLERVRRTGRPLRVTRFGKPVADIVPPSPEERQPEWLGSLRGTLQIRGDIVTPSSELVAWDALE